jgi:cob(I)alamin adenosyltransferase
MNTQLQVPPSSTHSRTTGFKWSLLDIKNSLFDAHDDLNAIKNDETYRFSAEDMKDIKNDLTAITMLLSELKEKI